MKYVLGLFVILLSGCVSQVLPPKVADTDLRIDRPVYVEPHKYPAYSRSLRSALEGTEIFSEVRSAKHPDPKPYVARVNRQDEETEQAGHPRQPSPAAAKPFVLFHYTTRKPGD